MQGHACRRDSEVKTLLEHHMRTEHINFGGISAPNATSNYRRRSMSYHGTIR